MIVLKNNFFCSSRFVPLLSSAEENCLCVVVGTKCDLITDTNSERYSRVVGDGLELAKELNKDRHFELDAPAFFVTSSLRNENVQDVFEFIFKAILPSPASGDSAIYNSKSREASRGCVDIHEPHLAKAKQDSKTHRCCSS